jgi:hypothetical protein
MGLSSPIRCTAKRVAAIALFVLAALTARPAHAARPADEPLSAAAPGQIVDLPGGGGLAEMFSFDERLVPALLALAPEGGQEIADFPIAPGVRRRVHLVRHEIYAEGARVFRVDGQFRTEVPRSRLVFFWGSDLEGAGNRLFVAFDPATRGFSGLVHGPEGTHEIGRDPADRRERHVLAQPRVPEGAAWTCGQEESVETAVSWAPSAKTRAESLSLRPNVLSSLHSGIVAIDTDNEYMTYWSNNTTNVTNYIATLLASINVMYERDLNLRLVQGTTFLRVSMTLDPYGPNPSSNASSAELNEFRNYWNTNYPTASYPRSVATLLSGKQPANNSASGIASLASSVCGSAFDYSFCQLFKMTYLYGDTLIVGHEIGHNLGSPHTHCYADPKPDTCYGSELGTNCFSGTPGCPAPLMINGYNATGTIMSYCQLSPCSSGATLAFHPSTISRYVETTLNTGRDAACIVPVGPGPPPPTPTSLYTITPCRIVDTRNASGPLGGPSLSAGATRSFTLTNTTCSLPGTASAVSLNATISDATGTGGVIVYPGNGTAPGTNTVSFKPGVNRANNILVGLTGGVLSVTNTSPGTVNLILDVNGYAQ